MNAMHRSSGIALALLLAAGAAAPAGADIVAGLEEFGELTLVDSIECASDAAHLRRDYPAGRSYATNILGAACVAIEPLANAETPNGQESACYVAWRVGRGRGLVPNDPYVLVIDYPDDAPRSGTVMNFGNWTHHGFATGFAVPDCMSPPYVAQALESYAVPLSGEFRQFREVMFPMERCQQVETAKKDNALVYDLPENGFDVVFALFPKDDCTDSVGVAVRSIRLYHVDDYAAARPEIHWPAGAAPRRHVTFREEMGDGYAMQGYYDDKTRAYEAKARLMSLLGVDTLSRDMLEFGYVQGWNTSYDGSLDGGRFAARQETVQTVRTVVTDPATGAATTNAVKYTSYESVPFYDGPAGQVDANTFVTVTTNVFNGYHHWSQSAETWPAIIERMAAEGHTILPYYEYSGGRGNYGWGSQGRRPMMLNTEGYGSSQGWSNQSWINAATADLTEEGTRADFEDLLNLTLLRFANEPRYEGVFLGAWMRNRAQVPMGFSDRAVARFAADESAWLLARGIDPATLTRKAIWDDLQAHKAEWEAANGKMDNVTVSQWMRWGSELYNRYREWWYLRRRDFFAAMRDYMATNGIPEARFFYHSCTAEPGEQWDSWGPETSIYAGGADSLWRGLDWRAMTGRSGNADMPEMASLYRTRALDTDFSNFWGLEVNHSAPADDYDNYGPAATARGEPQERIGLSYPYSRVYQVVDPAVSGAYRNASGDLFFVHHYSLNEHALQDKNIEDASVRLALSGLDDPDYFRPDTGAHQQICGYFCSDFDHAGRAVVLSELWAMAVSDPTMLARLYGTNIGQLDSGYFREFNLNYLSLPAQPGEAIRGGSWDTPDGIHVRRWTVPADPATGTPACAYYAVVNTGLHPWSGPVAFEGASAHVYRTVDFAEVDLDADATAALSLEPLQMVAFRTLAPDAPAVAVRATATGPSSIRVTVDVLALPSGTGSMSVSIGTREDLGDGVPLGEADLPSKGTWTFDAAGLDPDVRYFVRAVVSDAVLPATTKTTSARTAADPTHPRAALSVRDAAATSATLVCDLSTLGEGANAATIYVEVADAAGALAPRAYAFPGATYATAVSCALGGLSSSADWFATVSVTNDLGRGGLVGSVPFSTTGLPPQDPGAGRWQYGLWQREIPDFETSSVVETVYGHDDVDRANGPVMAAHSSRTVPVPNPLSDTPHAWRKDHMGFVYEGCIRLEGGKEYVVHHAFDDGTYIEIDGAEVGRNNSGYTQRNVFNRVSFPEDGWHFVKFAVWDAAGGVGPQTGLPSSSAPSGFVWNDLGSTNKSDKSIWRIFEDPGDGSFLRTYEPDRELVELDRPLSRDGDALVVPVSVQSFDEDNELTVFVAAARPADAGLHDPAAWDAAFAGATPGIGPHETQEVVAPGRAPAAGAAAWAIARLRNERLGREHWSLPASYERPAAAAAPELSAYVGAVSHHAASLAVRVPSLGEGAASATVSAAVSGGAADAVPATVWEAPGQRTIALAGLAPATDYAVTLVATASTGASADPVSLSFRTPSLAGPSATLFPSLVSFTNETFVVDVADLGTDADSADILLEFARSADFASNLVSETRTVLDAGPQEFALAALDPGTEYWVRVTVAGANGKSTVLGPLRVPTPAYTAPWFGAVACTELWPDSATVAVPLAALGDGSSYADVEWTLHVGGSGAEPPSTSGVFRLTAPATHLLSFPAPALAPVTAYTLRLRAVGSIGLETAASLSFATPAWLVEIGAHGAEVSAAGTLATLSATLSRASEGATLALSVNGAPAKAWTGVRAGEPCAFECSMALGTTNRYEFLAADATGRYTAAASGSFIARRSVGWFDVGWARDGYPAGDAWDAPAAAAASGGTWERPATDASALAAARLAVRAAAAPVAFVALAPSAAGRDVLAEGLAQFTPSAAPLAAEAEGVRAGLTLHLEPDGSQALYGYDGAAWRRLAGDPPEADAWVPWTAEFDFTGAPAVRYAVAGEVRPLAGDPAAEWIPLAGAPRALLGVAYSGIGGTGDFRARYYVYEPDSGGVAQVILADAGAGVTLEAPGTAGESFRIRLATPERGARHAVFAAPDLAAAPDEWICVSLLDAPASGPLDIAVPTAGFPARFFQIWTLGPSVPDPATLADLPNP